MLYSVLERFARLGKPSVVHIQAAIVHICMDTGSVALDLLRKRKPLVEEIGAVSLLTLKILYLRAWKTNFCHVPYT